MIIEYIKVVSLTGIVILAVPIVILTSFEVKIFFSILSCLAFNETAWKTDVVGFVAANLFYDNKIGFWKVYFVYKNLLKLLCLYRNQIYGYIPPRQHYLIF